MKKILLIVQRNENGILIGCHHGLSLKELRYMTKNLIRFSKKFNLSSVCI